MSASEAKKLKNKLRKQQLREQQEKQKQIDAERKKKEFQRNRNKEDGEEEKIKEDEIVAEKLERCEKPLDEAMKFLQPLEDFSPNYLETHYLGFEIYYRRSTLKIQIVKKLFPLSVFSREIFVDVTLFKTNEETRFKQCETSFIVNEISSTK